MNSCTQIANGSRTKDYNGGLVIKSVHYHRQPIPNPRLGYNCCFHQQPGIHYTNQYYDLFQHYRPDHFTLAIIITVIITMNIAV